MSRPTGLRSEIITQEAGVIPMKCVMVSHNRSLVERIRLRKREMDTEGKR